MHRIIRIIAQFHQPFALEAAEQVHHRQIQSLCLESDDRMRNAVRIGSAFVEFVEREHHDQNPESMPVSER